MKNRSHGGGKSSQREHSPNQNGVAKRGSSPDSRDHSNGSSENDTEVDNGDSTLEAFYNSRIHSASSSANQPEANEIFSEAKHSELCACSDDGTGKLSYDHGAMSPPGQAFSEDSQGVEMVPEDRQGPEPLFPELIADIIGRHGPMRAVIKLRSELGKAFKYVIYQPAFLRNRPQSEGGYSPIFFMADHEKGDLHCYGRDTSSGEWTRLPSLNFDKETLPSPEPDLFKDYLVAGDGGLMCINVGKATGREKLVVCNPLTQQAKVLPPLNHARHPVLMHLKVDHDSGHYKVIVAGSAAIGTEALSLKTEVYDSRKGKWDCPEGSDLPCPPFGLNEYQNGAYYKDTERELLMCVAIVDTRGRGVLVYDITKKKWAQEKQLHIPLVRSEPNVSHLATTQIIECGGFVFVFSEQECGRDVYFVIHKLIPEGSGDFTWDEVMKRKRTGGRGLLVYPEFTCVPVSEHELSIFNTVEHSVETIDLNNVTEVPPLQKVAPSQKGNRFHSLNPIGFVFTPSFRSVVCPRGRNPEFRCDIKGSEHCSECKRRDSESFTRSSGPKNDHQKLINSPAFAKESEAEVIPGESPEQRQVRHIQSCGNLAGERKLVGDKLGKLVLSK